MQLVDEMDLFMPSQVAEDDLLDRLRAFLAPAANHIDSGTGDCTHVIETDERLRDAAIQSTNDILIASATELSIYSPETNAHRRIHGGQDLSLVQRAPDDSWVATMPEEGQAHVWDLPTGMHLTVLSGHTGTIHTIDVADNSAVLVTIARDDTMRI